METVIKIDSLSVLYGKSEAISNISFEVKKGEFVSVIGPNGGGKTTLLNAILGFITPDSGRISVLNRDATKGNSSISYVPQVIAVDRSFPITVGQAVMSAFLKKGLHPFKRYSLAEKQRAEDLLAEVGLLNFFKKHISELSGGEFQRVLIARALAANPEILLLDEPTANIDPASAEKIFKILLSLNKKGMTVVAVTHDISAALSIADRLICVKTELVYDGEPKMNQDISDAMFGVKDIYSKEAGENA